MAREIIVKKITSGIPVDVGNIGLRELADVNDSALSALQSYIRYNDSANEFQFVDLETVLFDAGVLVTSINGQTGDVAFGFVDSADTLRIIEDHLDDSTTINDIVAQFDSEHAQSIVDKAARTDLELLNIDGGDF